MSKTGRAIILGSLAMTLTLGAALASGGDLTNIRFESRPAAMQDINRVGKSDRGALAARIAPSRTVAFNLPAQSVLVRISTPAPAIAPARRRAMVACEPVVSVLTEVAKLLQPGRCVT